MSKELAKTYDPHGIEDRLYEKWVEKKYFHAQVDRSKKPFTIVMPPPNITGQLHMGHALDNTMQDILIRFKRMQGYNALWQPGTDHASIATEVKIIEKLKEEGVDKHDLGREKFLERAWEWKKEYGGRITGQLRKLGSSCDWDRERFTMDEGCNKAVTEVFCKMHEKGWIYKGSRIINWCPVCNTSISDAEVVYEEQAGHFWHIKYPLLQEDGTPSTTEFLEFATTRPETMLGDTAVAVNPEDERYTSLIGRKVLLPLMNREIPIVADSYVDMEFGTGVVKITPAHDPNDFEVGKRHNLPEINIMNDDATINENGGKFAGMDRYEARAVIVKELEEMGLLVGIEDYSHNVGTHDRCKTTVEPLIKKQWFVKMDELIKPAVEGVKNGDIRLIPERMDKTYFNWTDNIRDWCISRQLWWGHQIPAWYKGDKVYVGKESPKEEGWTRDEDVLDTWFSSALWPFSTLGWPNKTDDLERYFPNDVLVTGYDIIFFWVCRMVFQSLKLTGKRPFKDCLIHGLIRDKEGRKMSKSLGNGVDPMDVIDNYGADSLRWFITTNSAPGQDLRYDEDKVKSTWNFINKIWNASRYVLMNTEDLKEIDLSNLTYSDKWILTKLNKTIKSVRKNMDKYDFNVVGKELYKFIWEDFCDTYIEYSKVSSDNISTKSCLILVLTDIIKMLHPFMPYVTDEIYNSLPVKDKENIILSSYPKYNKDMIYKKEEKEIDILIEVISKLRNIKKENNIPKGFGLINKFEEEYKDIIDKNAEILTRQLKCDIILSSFEGATESTALFPYGSIVLCYQGIKSTKEEKETLEKEKESLISSIERRKKLLSNEGYVKNAPEKIVNSEREKLKDEENKLKALEEKLK